MTRKPLYRRWSAALASYSLTGRDRLSADPTARATAESDDEVLENVEFLLEN
jgi:hypothetical protein